MHFEDKSEAFRQVVGKDQLAKLQEQRMLPEHNSAAMVARRPMRKNLELRSMTIFVINFFGLHLNEEHILVSHKKLF